MYSVFSLLLHFHISFFLSFLLIICLRRIITKKYNKPNCTSELVCSSEQPQIITLGPSNSAHSRTRACIRRGFLQKKMRTKEEAIRKRKNNIIFFIEKNGEFMYLRGTPTQILLNARGSKEERRRMEYYREI